MFELTDISLGNPETSMSLPNIVGTLAIIKSLVRRWNGKARNSVWLVNFLDCLLPFLVLNYFLVDTVFEIVSAVQRSLQGRSRHRNQYLEGGYRARSELLTCEVQFCKCKKLR